MVPTLLDFSTSDVLNLGKTLRNVRWLALRACVIYTACCPHSICSEGHWKGNSPSSSSWSATSFESCQVLILTCSSPGPKFEPWLLCSGLSTGFWPISMAFSIRVARASSSYAKDWKQKKTQFLSLQSRHQGPAALQNLKSSSSLFTKDWKQKEIQFLLLQSRLLLCKTWKWRNFLSKIWSRDLDTSARYYNSTRSIFYMTRSLPNIDIKRTT